MSNFLLFLDILALRSHVKSILELQKMDNLENFFQCEDILRVRFHFFCFFFYVCTGRNWALWIG